MTGNTSKHLVSVIMPAFNAERYVAASIGSVLNQSYPNWELLIIDNNSSDKTLEISQSFQDQRIKIFTELRQGVSHARNKGLLEMTGYFFCFLDADDLLTEKSLEVRLEKFHTHSNLHFVDGQVHYIDPDGNFTGRTYTPSFEGYPLPALMRLDERCLFGPSWMIRRRQGVNYSFATDMTHAEDLYFYLTIARQGKYSSVDESILHYRVHTDSAMRNLQGLENGYHLLLKKVKENFANEYDPYLKRRIMRIMFLSWLVDGRNPWKAIRSIFRFLTV